MIVSASRKTDLPACYGEWFRQRLRAGYCRVVNPYRPDEHRTVWLQPGDLDGFVFWTKHVGPFLPALREVAGLGFRFVVQHTLTGYPRELEPSVVSPERAAECCRRLTGEMGPRALVWRYDPILLSDLTPPGFHRRSFDRLADLLAGSTDEVVAKFVVPYGKTRRNLQAVGAHGLRWWAPDGDQARELVEDLAGRAAARGMTLRLCCEPGLSAATAPATRCTDPERLGRGAAEARPTRPGCRCAASVDIGEYDTCPHGCAYCYAVRDPALARRRYRRHDPASEYLFPPEVPAADARQLSLF